MHAGTFWWRTRAFHWCPCPKKEVMHRMIPILEAFNHNHMDPDSIYWCRGIRWNRWLTLIPRDHLLIIKRVLCMQTHVENKEAKLSWVISSKQAKSQDNLLVTPSMELEWITATLFLRKIFSFSSSPQQPRMQVLQVMQVCFPTLLVGQPDC